MKFVPPNPVGYHGSFLKTTKQKTYFKLIFQQSTDVQV